MSDPSHEHPQASEPHESAASEPASDEAAPEHVLVTRAKDLIGLAKTDIPGAERAFKDLGFDAQLESALVLQGDDLHEWLMLAEDATELVREIPAEHLHHTIRLMGEEDALQMMAAASSAQFQAMMDIEWFSDNKLDKRKVRKWIELLLELDPDEADEVMLGVDLNALGSYLRTRIKPKVHNDYLLLMVQTNQSFLMDPDLFDTNDDLIERFIQFIWDVDRDLFAELMTLMFLEEEEIVTNDMYAGREDRLIMRGFPALAKAERLLEPIDYASYGPLWPNEDAQIDAEEHDTALARARKAGPFLLHALAWGRSSRALGDRTERAFIREAAELANSLLLAHAKDSGDPEVKKLALSAVNVLASLGLEGVTGGNLISASESLRSMDMYELFRLGFTLTREVAQDAWNLSHDARIERARLPGELKWLNETVRASIYEAVELMDWQEIAKTGLNPAEKPPGAQEPLTWPRLCLLRQTVQTGVLELERRSVAPTNN